MEYKIYKNIDECKKIWNELSPDNRLFDLWEFRLCFYDKQEMEPYFITGYEGKDILGLIPLCFFKSKNQYNYFGGWFPERNSFFLKDKSKLPLFLQQCPENTFMEGIDPQEGKYFSFLDDEPTYYLDLHKYDNSFEKYFTSFEKKRQKKIKAELKKIPQYKVHFNRLKDFNRLVELNIKAHEEDSIFNQTIMKNSILKIFKLANRMGILQMISIEINKKVESVDLGIKFGEWFDILTGGSNNHLYPNIGKLNTILDIKNAMTNKARYVDFLATSGHWKESWNFDKEMMLKFVK